MVHDCGVPSMCLLVGNGVVNCMVVHSSKPRIAEAMLAGVLIGGLFLPFRARCICTRGASVDLVDKLRLSAIAALGVAVVFVVVIA